MIIDRFGDLEVRIAAVEAGIADLSRRDKYAYLGDEPAVHTVAVDKASRAASEAFYARIWDGRPASSGRPIRWDEMSDITKEAWRLAAQGAIHAARTRPANHSWATFEETGARQHWKARCQCGSSFLSVTRQRACDMWEMHQAEEAERAAPETKPEAKHTSLEFEQVTTSLGYRTWTGRCQCGQKFNSALRTSIRDMWEAHQKEEAAV